MRRASSFLASWATTSHRPAVAALLRASAMTVSMSDLVGPDATSELFPRHDDDRSLAALEDVGEVDLARHCDHVNSGSFTGSSESRRRANSRASSSRSCGGGPSVPSSGALESRSRALAARSTSRPLARAEPGRPLGSRIDDTIHADGPPARASVTRCRGRRSPDDQNASVGLMGHCGHERTENRVAIRRDLLRASQIRGQGNRTGSFGE